MAAVQQQTTQLEFYQAMADFKTMFPSMDDDVIEAVLRSNQGAVDATIDQLLAMSTDNENEKIRNEIDLIPQPASVPVENPLAGSLREKKGWNPPLLGRLPPNFLRLDSKQLDSELEDERIAVLLQNEEFMAELRWNKDFLSTLDKDSPPEERTFNLRSGDEDDLFKERLRNMGKMSRKKFSQLARVFTGRKKRGPTAKAILSQGPAPSRDNLLLREDDSDGI